MTFNHDQIKWKLSHLKAVAGQLRDLLDHYFQQPESFRSHAIGQEIGRMAIDLRQCWASIQEYQDTPGEKIPGTGAEGGRATDSVIFHEVLPVPMIFAMQPYGSLVKQLLTDARHVVAETEDLPDCFSN